MEAGRQRDGPEHGVEKRESPRLHDGSPGNTLRAVPDHATGFGMSTIIDWKDCRRDRPTRSASVRMCEKNGHVNGPFAARIRN